MSRSLLVALFVLAGCTASSSDSDDALRGSLGAGKADTVWGSCEDSCGEQSADGWCYCDDACAGYGDCCADKDWVCGSEAQACGGLLGLGCAADEYCHYELDAMCGAADATGVCVTKPEACAKIGQPVCGCDDQTYGNPCEAHRAGVSVVAEGACAPAPRLCGSRGLAPCEADEFCAFEAEAQCGAADHPGVCTKRPEACLQVYQPVCGCDGQTHGNACSAASAGVAVASEGPCEEFCGGFGNLQCSDPDAVCVDDPNDDCDPNAGGADCGGYCAIP